MTNFNKLLVINLIVITFVLSACTHAQLSYQLDPELNNFPPPVANTKLIAFDLIDKTSTNQSISGKESVYVVSDRQQFSPLSQKFINRLKALDYKIISNPLLADIAITIEISQLDLLLEKGIFKSKFNAYSQIKFTINKKSEPWSKIYKANKTQEVANPATNLDATGIINQLLSEQLEKGFSDPSLLKFLKKQ